MNTSKQINAMIILMAMLLVGIGFYTIYDPFRQETEQERTRNDIAERAGLTYARNCRVCHGDNGEGRIGPALNPEFRNPPLTNYTDPNKTAENSILVRNTIECGRVGTRMPSWAIDQGGALNEEQIRQLVIVLTTPKEAGLWHLVEEQSKLDEQTAPMPAVTEVPVTITGATGYVCGQKPVAAAAPVTAPDPKSTWTIVATDNKFDLPAMAVKAGEASTIEFQNKGQALHNINIKNLKDSSGRDVKTDLLPGGQSATLRFTAATAGEYPFVCDIHPEMTGTFFVVQ